MNKRIFSLLLILLLCCVGAGAQATQKSDLQQRAEEADAKGSVATARYTYIRAFEDYVDKGQTALGVDCGVKATALYYRENYFKEAFELLRRIDQAVAAGQLTEGDKAALRYKVSKERLQMYMKLHKSANVTEQLGIMEGYAGTTADEGVKSDLLYTKALCYYSLGQNAKADAVFKEMAAKLTAEKEYDKVDQVYQTLIENGRKAGNASLVARSYGSYMAWKDSVSAIKAADEVNALKQQIAQGEETIAGKDSSLSARRNVIIALCILAAILAGVLVLGAIVLLRFILLARKQKKTIAEQGEDIAVKAKFISNMTAQLDPTLRKMDSRLPEVKALTDFSGHVQTLAALEAKDSPAVEVEDTPMTQFCEELMDQVRPRVKGDVALVVNVPKMSANINKEYVSHILLHLLDNAVAHTPEGKKITLEFKKRSAHTCQFLVTDTGEGIPEEKRDGLFRPFREVRDLTQGDGLGLPICKRMAQRMKGDLDLDTTFTKGTRFVLTLPT